jgi:hypothetical protein
MSTGLQDRAGKNAALKPFAGALAAYGSHRSYVLNQASGHQILIPGPPLPGSGSKNTPPRAQDTAGQSDLGQERYMGARSRIVLAAGANFGNLFGITGDGTATGVAGDVVLVRSDGKAIKIGTIALTGVDEANPAEYDGTIGSFFCLAPGEDIVFIPDATISTTGTGLFVPNFIDGDLINHRTELTVQKQTCMLVPPGKCWYTPAGMDDLAESSFVPLAAAYRSLGILNLDTAAHDVNVYINPGSGADIRFAVVSCPGGAFTPIPLAAVGDGDNALFLPAGHSIKASLAVAGDDVLFCCVVAETNQAHIGDEEFAQASIVEGETTSPTG